jgi:hypothetical protein
MIDELEEQHRRTRGDALNINSYISIGLLITIILGCCYIKDGQRDNEVTRIKESAENAKANSELKVQIANLSRDMTDRARDRITFTEVWHWAVALQRANTEAGIKLIVPEPQHETNQ